MTTQDRPATSRELRSLVTRDGLAGKVELRLVDVPIPEPEAGQVVVRVEAAPINPSDLGLLLAGADLSTAEVTDAADGPVLTAAIPEAAMRSLAGRVGTSLTVGNEGAGTVVSAGSSPEARSLVGRMVAVVGGRMYAQYRTFPAAQCLVLPEGTPASVGAAAFVNPLTALGMVETMRREGHTALVHTAAASNLGQMLNKVCLEDQMSDLVNVVRKPEQEELLRSIGAALRHATRRSPVFHDRPHRGTARRSSGATLAFDAIGGGALVGQILTAMEVVASATLRAPTADTDRRRTSRSTSTAVSTAARQCSTAASAWPGESADGC